MATVPATSRAQNESPPFSYEIANLILENVLAVSASGLDPSLPRMSLNDWLTITFEPMMEPPGEYAPRWHVTWCEYRGTAMPGIAVPVTGPELCAHGEIGISRTRKVHIVLAVAELDTRLSPDPWRPTDPSVREVYIQGWEEGTSSDSLDVPTLSEIPPMLRWPMSSWPDVDVQTRITWTPTHPRPGDVVRVSIWVANFGKRSVARARVHYLIAPWGQSQDGVDWLPDLPQGQWVRLDRDIVVLEGSAFVTVSATPLSLGDRFVREDKRDNNESTASIEPIGRVR